MDINALTETVMRMLVAAQSGAVQAITDTATKLGAAGIEKLSALVRGRFTSDGAGATKALETFDADATNVDSQIRVKNRLAQFLVDDPQFAADVKAIIGEAWIDSSIEQHGKTGDNSTLVQAVNSTVTIR